MTLTEIHHFVGECRLGVLGTIGEDGAPQSSLIGIAVTDALEIVFDTVRQSRKYGNLKAHPRCSFAIGWDGERTVQYEGDAEELAGAALGKYQPVYFAKFPDGPERLAWPGITYFVVRPRWIRYSGYDERPPRIEEFRF